ncbi:MAG: hypothetical protein KGS61_09860 [Verrucomicrobia bacterium]|nr:hypothetical protein [Verrucomicrobiota bacterium]
MLALLSSALSVPGAIIFVNANAPTNPPPDGRSWLTAFPTAQAGLATAQPGDEVWVAAGTYAVAPAVPPAGFVVGNGVGFYGGFNGTETNRDQRNRTTNVTILEGGGLPAHIVTVLPGATNTTRVDGFTIQNSGQNTASVANGGGIYFTNASPVIANNVITQNRAANSGGGIYCTNSWAVLENNRIIQNFVLVSGSGDGDGIYCGYSVLTISNNVIAGNGLAPNPGGFGGGIASEFGADIIVSNRIFGNTAGAGGGILCFHSTPDIAFNVVADNQASVIGGGIESNNSSPKIHNNRIVGNVVTASGWGGGGLSCYGDASPQFYNNLILSNTVQGAASQGGGGILCEPTTSPSIFNNTLLRNQAPSGGGILSLSTNQPSIVNNLVAFGSSGVYGTNALDFRNNDVFGNDATNFAGFSDPTGTSGNLSVDPQLVENDDFLVARLAPTSACVDAGDSTVVQPDWLALDGQPRVQGAAVDIGADESNGNLPPSVPQIVRVSPAGNDANDGAAWSQPKQTVQAAIDQAAQTGGEVWVAAGTYAENLQLKMFTAIYGGFAGTETSRTQRDWTTNPTILDGGQLGSVVSALWIDHYGAIDGFTIQNGNAPIGGGVFCEGSPIGIQFNNITGNTAVNGGGIAVLEGERWLLTELSMPPWPVLGLATPYIADNRITENLTVPSGTSTANGAGIYLRSTATVVNNLIADNRAQNPAAALSRQPRGRVGLTDYGQYAGAAGVFSDVQDYGVAIANNTILRNTASGVAGQGTAGGIYAWFNGIGSTLPASTIANNILAFNSSGLVFDPIADPPAALRGRNQIALLNNCLFGNGTVDYSGAGTNLFGADTNNVSGNFSADPLIAGPPDGVHEFPDSPCVAAGDSAVVQPGWLDIDGLGRIRGLSVDIGASQLGWPRTWQPVMLATNAVPVEIVTVGGITYARYSITYGGCEQLTGIGPAIRAGTNLFCDFDLRNEVGVLCPDLIVTRKGVVVLGALPAGDYLFITTAWGRWVSTLPFSVPANTTPTLVPISSPADGQFAMQLNGIDGVDYQLQVSTNLVDWAPLFAATNGVPMIDSTAGSAATRFYRVQIGR